jgi:hypothetical protein
MGLLGDGWDDPKTLATLQLAGGLLSPGSFGQGLSRGLAGYQGALTSAKELELKNALLQSAQQEQQLRALNIRLQGMKMDQAQQYLDGGAGPSAFGAGAAAMGAVPQSGGLPGPTTAAAAMQTSAPAGGHRLESVTPDQAAAFLQIGLWNKDNYDLWKAVKEGIQINPNTYRADLYGGSPKYYGDPTKGITLGADGSVQQMPNAGATLGAIAGATKGGELTATNAMSPAAVDLIERAEMRPGTSVSALMGNGRTPVAGAPLSAQPMWMQQQLAADVARNGGGPATFNGMPVGGAGFKTTADLAADKIRAEGAAKLATDPAIKFATAQAEQASAATKDINDRVRVGQDLMARVDEARKALTGFQPGMGADARLQAARFAQAVGLPDAIVQRINLGDVGAKQEFEKLTAQMAMESLKQAMGGSGRITQAEFKVFKDNNPNIAMDPQAIGKIYDFAARVYRRDFSEQQAHASFLTSGGDPAQWPAVWARTVDPSGSLGSAPAASKGGIDQAAIAAELERRRKAGQ